MKVSYNWLKEYLNFSDNVDVLADILTSTGLEVEGVSLLFSSFDHLIVGKVLECESHPNADRLKITKVDVGGEVKQIICGAPNVKKNQFVIVVLSGNEIVNVKGEKIKIKKTKIRGEISDGMICGEDEIGLGNEHQGIVELDSNCKPGALVSEYLKIKKDYCIEIGLTPNRTDSFGHIGVCRDLYAYFHHKKNPIKLSFPDISAYSSNNSQLSISLDVSNKLSCPEYLGVCIENVIVQESPRWLKNKLISIGLKPINNVVDITNFVLHETGNPLHAFDYNQISDHKIIVRNAKSGEKIKTLDGQSIDLDKDDLVICDSKKPLCLAGVMGGDDSGVTAFTKNIFLESAFFNSQSIRKTSKRHGIMTDSSYRFERGVDFTNCEYALQRASLLIQEICQGSVGEEVKFSSKKTIKHEVDFSFSFCDKILGHHIDKKKIINILIDLGFQILADNDDSCKLSVPAFRNDVYREIDVVEEILRIYGYDNLPAASLINFEPLVDFTFSLYQMKIDISNLLVSNGFFEIQNNSLIPESSLKVFNDLSIKNVVKILNPLSQDLSIMRPNMFFSGLKTIKHNLNRQNNNIKLFEFGKTYKKLKGAYLEEEKMTIFSCGVFKGENWAEESKSSNFFYIKGVFDKILHQLFVGNSNFEIKESESECMELKLSYLYDKNIVGEVGLFSTKTLNALGLKKEVYYVDLNLDVLFSILSRDNMRYEPVPKFPSVKRDLSLLVDQDVSYLEIKQAIESQGDGFLKKISLFDVYIGDKIEKSKKSYAISFLFQNNDRTLTDLEVDKEMIRIYKHLVNQFQLSLREGELKLN